MRSKLVAGNWKMNGIKASLVEVEAIAAACRSNSDVDVALFVPATLIADAVSVAGVMMIGGQDCHANDCGAHTGNIAAPMLVEAGARLVIVGHSERRADQGETDVEVKAKAEAARRHGLGVILCVGETLDERGKDQAEQVVSAQIARSLPDGADGEWLSIAYEPVWAIGTGRTPTETEVAAVHGAIRAQIGGLLGGDAAASLRILYGGSVNGANAASLLACADVDGALVGGASLTARDFVPIIEAAASQQQILP